MKRYLCKERLYQKRIYGIEDEKKKYCKEKSHEKEKIDITRRGKELCTVYNGTVCVCAENLNKYIAKLESSFVCKLPDINSL
mgnify:CR=1 FL=1